MLPAHQAATRWRRIARRCSHAITVTSSEALGYLWDMFDEQDKERLAAVPLFVPHARIAKAAHNLGWLNVITTAGGMTVCSQVW